MYAPQIQPSGPAPARVMIVGEAPGDMEVFRGLPFEGPSGQELNRQLEDAGLMRSMCFCTTVVRVRPHANDISNFIPKRKADVRKGIHQELQGKWVTPEVIDGFRRLKLEVDLCQPNVIIAAGNVALWALAGRSGITSWRGSILEGVGPALGRKVIPLLHPAAILRQWVQRPISINDLKRVKNESAYPEIRKPPWKFLLNPTYQQVCTQLQLLYNRAETTRDFLLSVDIETRAGHIACIGVAWSKLEAICIPLMSITRSDASHWTLAQETQIVWMLQRLLGHRNVKCIGQNFSYDAQYLARHWLWAPKRIGDTMLAHHSVFSNTAKGLDVLSSLYCDFHEYWKDDLKEWNTKVLDEEHLWRYNCIDTVITYEVWEKEQQVIKARGMEAVNDFQQAMLPLVLRTMNKGVRIDHARRAQLDRELDAEMVKRQSYLESVFGHEINIRSPAQLKNLFYTDLGVKAVLKRQPNGKWSPTLGKEAIAELMVRQPLLRQPLRAIKEFRSLGVLLSTFIRSELDVDGRMRCSYNLGGTETFRLSSSTNAFNSGMNLQNIPGGEDDEEYDFHTPNIRELFLPDIDHTIWDGDLGGADLRIVVAESGELDMQQMLDAGLNIYVETGREYYRDPSISKQHPKYRLFKSFAHGTHYLGTPKGLANRIGLTVHECERIQKWYFGRFPAIRKWQDEFKLQVSKRRWIENIFGYRLNIFDRIEGTVFNQAIAWLPQSTIAILTNKIWHAIDTILREEEACVLMQVHDSLVGQTPTEIFNVIKPRLLAAAAIPLAYPKPITIPWGFKSSTKSWGACA